MTFAAQRLLLILIIAAAALLFVVETRPSDSSAPSGEVPSWRKYFRNDSLTWSVVPCSDEEKFCLQRGLLLHPESGKCYLWGKSLPCEETDKIFRVDKHELLTSGNVRGACVKRNLCSDRNEYKMAADGSCLSMSAVGQMCYGQEGVAVSENLFGETECAFASYGEEAPSSAATTSEVPQGQCLVPNLRETVLPSHPFDRMLSTARSQVRCTENERRCFLDGRIYFEPHDLCYSLWEQGPCKQGEWFALEEDDEPSDGVGNLTGVCRTAPCGSGRVKAIATPLYAVGSCVTPLELCAGGYHVAFDVEGVAACAWSPFVPLRMPTERKKEGGVCGFPEVGRPETATDHFYPPPPPPPSACPESKNGFCDRDVEGPVAS